MTRHPMFGIFLALFGALAITPDTLLMRLSGLGGGQMVAWRGLLAGTSLTLAWALFRHRHWRGDLRGLASGGGALVVLCQFLSAALFSLGIAAAPVAVVLFAISSVPVFSALLSRLVLGEATHWSTWAAIAAVLTGIGIAVFGKSAGPVVGTPLLGAAAGLGVAMSLAVNFVTIRRNPQIPIPLAVGCGALVSGLVGLGLVGPATMLDGRIWAIVLAGGVVLPASFFSLSLASRHTQASTVSLLMLLETILGPVWVWAGTGEALTRGMVTGGALVIGSLAVYLWYAGRRQALARRAAVAAGALGPVEGG
ncbi:DMT family transporter [Acidimangrovimonas pyrenivorans]|uniref:DMT family transporter n=1 Tax=Acidimangrovimonas pyrenivorans TaxID=2030798 RepID=A0ABV7ABR2_9RHOB